MPAAGGVGPDGAAATMAVGLERWRTRLERPPTTNCSQERQAETTPGGQRPRPRRPRNHDELDIFGRRNSLALSALNSASGSTAVRLVSALVQGLLATGRGGRGHDSAPTDWLTQTPLVPASNASHCVTVRDTLPAMASADDKVEQPMTKI